MSGWLNGHRESLPPRIMQLVGLGGFLGISVFWAITGRIEPTLLAATGSFVGFGHYVGAVSALRNNDVKPDDTTAGESPRG